MKAVLVLLLLYFTSAFAIRCTPLAGGGQCCGLVIGIFSAAFSTNDYFAQKNGFFAEENVTVCYVTIASSVTLYNNLAAGLYDLVGANVDNAIWRTLNLNWNLSVLAGTDGNRGYYLVGNTETLGGYNSVSALAGKNILVDGLDSGFVVGLWKILNDFNILHNVTYTTLGTNRLPFVINGTYNNQTQYATMVSGTAPYLLPYPAYPLAQLSEHLCPAQGAAYATFANWSTDPVNQGPLKSFFRALIRSYQWQLDPLNKEAVLAYLSSVNGNSNPQITTLIYDDVYKNYAAGLNSDLTVRKLGMKNIVSTRILVGLSPYPPVSIDNFIEDRFGGLVDQTVLRQAQAELGVTNNYDTDAGTLGCATGNKGTIVTVPPQLTCSASYVIDASWSTGFTASLTISVNNASLLQVNGIPGWQVTFSAKGFGSVPAFSIISSWNTGSFSQSTTNTTTSYTLNSASYNAQSPSSIGWIASTSLAAPYNNVCGIKINGVACAVSTPSTASVSC